MPHFNDIKPYTRDGTYTSDIPFSYLEKKIQEFLDEDGLELVPDFQRGHVWDEKRQIAFVEHILRGGRGSHVIRFNHPGWMKDWKGQMVLVDGLQRITAIRRFLNNEIAVFGNYFSEWEGKLVNRWTLTFIINDLPTRADVLQWYLEINEGAVPHTDEELERVRILLENEISND